MEVAETKIHPTAVVDPGAEIGAGVEIGPYCVVHEGVVLGDGCWLQNHVTLSGPSRFGERNRFFAYSAIGQMTQDLKYEGEPTHLEVGDENVFREFTSVNRGTLPGEKTVIGNRGVFLAYSHVAHDCIVGDDVIFSNNGTLAGHVVVEDHAILGGLTAVHQFCRIGRFSITGGCSKIVQDIPPFMIADGNPAQVRGVNSVGLKRNGASAETQRLLKEAYRVVYRKSLNVKDAIAELGEAAESSEEVAHFVDFIRKSERGIIR
jgi:UDP-N-acetylglucosamine acyltransferase